MVDAYSKWLEVKLVASTSSQAAIKELKYMFANYGLPQVLVTDNGTAFTSAEFGKFMDKNGIRHVETPPYHPASNGQIERYVQEVKKSLYKSSASDVHTKLARFMFTQHSTPSRITGMSPAELLGRKMRINLHNIHPKTKISKQVVENRKQIRTFSVGQKSCPFSLLKPVKKRKNID